MGLFSRLKEAAEGFIKIFTGKGTIRPVQSEESQHIEEMERDYEEEARQRRLERLRERGRDSINEANRLYDELIRQDLDEFSPSFQEAKASGGSFDVEDLDDETSIIREIKRAEDFLQSEGSNIEVVSLLKRQAEGEEITKEIKEKYGLDLYRTRDKNDNIVKGFWEIVDRMREIEGIGSELARLTYSKDAAYSVAFARWEEAGAFADDYQTILDALQEFIDEADAAQSVKHKAESGVASFKKNGDW